MRFKVLFFLELASFFFVFSACRGQKSEDPPFLPLRNMVDQSSYGPQSQNTFFKDGLAARPPVPGTVAVSDEVGQPELSDGLESGSTLKNPVWVKKIPIPLSEQVLQNGREHYNIYCAPCHGYAGYADGLVTQRAGGSIRPANLHDKAILNLPAGQIYSAIKNGVNNWNMPGFAAQIDVEDRWAIVAYVRALQLSQQADLDAVPADVQSQKGWGKEK